MDGSLVVESYLTLSDDGLLAQCHVDHYRSSGPGGQKRNKTSSAVRLRHQPTGLSVTASENRSQHVNLAYALRRLREALALNVRTPLDAAEYEASPLLRECVSDDGTFRINERDPRYHQAVQEILDVVSACGAAVGEAAGYLGMSTGQLGKLLHSNVKVWTKVNQMRAALGLKRLHG